jgi:hypothetical protein
MGISRLRDPVAIVSGLLSQTRVLFYSSAKIEGHFLQIRSQGPWTADFEEDIGYSCADNCVSLSRHALSFKRRHTQQSPSVELGAQSASQTVHLAGFFNRSSSIARLAFSMITSGTTLSAASGTPGACVRLRFTSPLYQAAWPVCRTWAASSSPEQRGHC